LNKGEGAEGEEAVLHSTLGEREGKVVLFMQHLGEGRGGEREIDVLFIQHIPSAKQTQYCYLKINIPGAYAHNSFHIYTLCCSV
jgi:hypothetical protein